MLGKDAAMVQENGFNPCKTLGVDPLHLGKVSIGLGDLAIGLRDLAIAISELGLECGLIANPLPY